MILNQLKMKLMQKQDLISIKLTLLLLWWCILYVYLEGFVIIVNRSMYSKTPKHVMILLTDNASYLEAIQYNIYSTQWCRVWYSFYTRVYGEKWVLPWNNHSRSTHHLYVSYPAALCAINVVLYRLQIGSIAHWQKSSHALGSLNTWICLQLWQDPPSGHKGHATIATAKLTLWILSPVSGSISSWVDSKS